MMTDGPESRPDPDALLRRVQADERVSSRGRLKLFLGAAPGVGKTFAMLEAARVRRREGVDVVAGVVETHGRAETAALLAGIETLPKRKVAWRGAELEEFDLDAARARRPQLLLVDELAHTNAPGSRHEKRYQDVLELLDDGVDVYSTLNIQHVESLNDVVAQITGVTVRETLPDSVLERADEIELVDLPPEELIQRLEEGKVYVGAAGRRALDNFFKKGNLIALRELALRKAAERVGVDMEAYRREHDIPTVWPAAAKLLVCVGPSPLSARVIRTASRMAQSLHAEWLAVHVETPYRARASEDDEERVLQHLLLAEQLGARTRVVEGLRISTALLEFARAHNATMIVIGSPARAGWRVLQRGTLVQDVMREAGAIEVHIVSGGPGEIESAARGTEDRSRGRVPWLGYAVAPVIVAACAIVAAWLRDTVVETDLAMLFLVGIAVAAFALPRGPALLTTLLAVAAYDFFCVPPYSTFTVSDVRHVLTFVVMTGIGMLLSSLAQRVVGQARAARKRERTAAALYDLSRDLAECDDAASVFETAARSIHGALGFDVTLFAPDAGGALATVASRGRVLNEKPELAVAEWCRAHAQPAGSGTPTLPGSAGLYLPLKAGERVFGVAGVRIDDDSRAVRHPESRALLDAFTTNVAHAVERVVLASEAEDARVQVKSEQMRSALLSSVSHDLRTPLAGIVGAASTLIEKQARLDDSVRKDLTRAILEEAARLGRLLQNLLEMTRIEGGGLKVKKEWQVPEEVIGSAIGRLGGRLAGHDLKVEVDPDVALAPFDALLIEQVLINLLENAAKYGPADGAIEVTAREREHELVIEVSDRGPGLDEDERVRVFDKFYRGRAKDAPGAGLGLTICKAIVEAHGGRIWAANRAGGGATFGLALPLGAAPKPIAGGRA